MAEKHARHPQNAAGPFYVVNGECISCGAPESEAEGLMSHDGAGHCFFARQPTTEEETNSAIRGVWASCCGAVRYGGNETKTLIRLAELGVSSQCDLQLPGSHQQIAYNCARFEYAAPHDGALSKRNKLRLIIVEIAEMVRYPEAKCFGFRCWLKKASFRLRWGMYGKETGHSVRFRLTHELGNTWFLEISENALAQTAFAIHLDKELQKNSKFRSIQWFEETDWRSDRKCPKQHPY